MEDLTIFEKHSELFTTNIGMYYCGKRIKTKNHTYGPEIRTHYLLVLVKSGSAVLHKDGKDIPFGKNDLLVMFPDEKIHYTALTDWSINWIGVCGDGLEEIFEALCVTRKYPLLHTHNTETLLQIMNKLYDIKYDNTLGCKYATNSLLLNFFAELIANTDKAVGADPVATATEIIKYNYNNDISIKALAEMLFLDSAYFSRLFKEKLRVSPKQYILNLRLEKAKELLCESDYTIKEISLTVGFADSLYFSKLFYKKTGLSPTSYRKTAAK